jgi:hypothetical protein
VAELQQVHKYPLAPKHDHSAPDVLIEFAETTHRLLDNAHGAAEYIVKGAKFYYGQQAFRKYDWLRGAAVLNKAKPKPNLRGMVLNKRARTLFELTVEKGEKLDKFGDVLILAGWAIELVKSKNYLEKVWQSNDNTAAKWQKTSAEISMATVRALTGVVPGASHLVATALLKGVHRAHLPQSWEANITRTDLLVNSYYTKWTNTDNVVNFINTHLVEQ